MLIRNRNNRNEFFYLVRKITVLWPRLKNFRLVFLLIWIVPLLVFFSIHISRNVRIKNYKLSSGKPGGFYEPIGSQLCKVINQHASNSIIVENDTSTAGSMENISKISIGKADFALTQDGLPADSKVKSMLYLFDSPLHIVVNKSLASKDLSELSGKRIYIGLKKSGTEYISNRILMHYGIDSIKYVRVGNDWNFQKAANQLILGNVDAAFFLVASNSKAIERIALTNNFALMNLSRAEGIARLEPALKTCEIPTGAYTCIHNFPENSVKTVATREILVCSKDIPDAVVGKVLKTILENISELVSDYPLASQASKLDPQRNFYYPLHQGALNVYEKNEPSLLTPSFLLSLFSLLFTQTIAAKYIPQYFRYKLLFQDILEIDFKSAHGATHSKINYIGRLQIISRKINVSFVEGKISSDFKDRLLKYCDLLSENIKLSQST